MTRTNEAPEPKGTKPFPALDAEGRLTTPTPPPEVLDALDRAARVLGELGRKNVTVALEQTGAASPLRVMLHHPGSASRELSHNQLLNLLDGDTSLIGRAT